MTTNNESFPVMVIIAGLAVAFFVIIWLALSSQMPKVPAAPPPSEVGFVCTQEYEPVCGADGRTYGNRCEAEYLAKVAVAHEGPCGVGIGPFEGH